MTHGEEQGAFGIICENCGEILGNTASAFLAATECVTIGCRTSSVGADVGGATLVDGNEFRGGCGLRAIGLSVAGSVRVQNNLLSGGECVSPDHVTKSVGIAIGNTTAMCVVGPCFPGGADVHSNRIEGGRGTSCTSVGIELLAVAVRPRLRNNLVLPGECAQAIDIDQTSPSLYAAALEHNDLAPGLPGARLYRIQGATDPAR